MRIATVSLSFGMLAMCAAVPAAAQSLPLSSPEKEGFSPELLGRIEQVYGQGVASQEIPGAVVMIARNGRVIYDKAIGFSDPANQTPMKKDTVFWLASMTKPVTTIATLMLSERGLIALNEPVSTYLPELKGMQVTLYQQVKDVPTAVTGPANREPTVQDLLRHTAGYLYANYEKTSVGDAYTRADLLNLDSTLAQMVTKLGKLPLAYQPGTMFAYSPADDVLGRLIEVVSGQSLDLFIDQNIAKPLKLDSFKFYADPSRQLARSGEFVRNIRAKPSLLSGGAGMFGTAGDYLRFAQMLLNGGELDGVRLVSPKTIAAMTSNQLPPCTRYPASTLPMLSIIAPMPQMGQGYGYGVAVRTSAGRNPLPGSVGDFYWAGAGGTYFWVDPQEKLVAISMTAERRSVPKVKYRQLARQLVYQAMLTTNPPLAGQDQTASGCTAS